MHDVTLQINLSPGDVAYARATVPPLVEAHRANVDETLVIANCCRPERTKFVDPDRHFPEPEFGRRVEELCRVCEQLQQDGYIDRVVYLRPGDPLLAVLAKKYLRGLVRETHDAFGHGLMAHIAGLEVPRTRYVLHYDADMLLYQAPGYDWSVEARSLMEEKLSSRVLAATPRISPPFHREMGVADAPSLHEELPLIPVEGGWLNSWFSTRCLLLDRQKFSPYLPLLKGWVLVEVLARKYLRRSYPLSPEIMLFRRVGGSGGLRLNLSSERAWLLHPETKSSRYLKLLPGIQRAIAERRVPPQQRGHANINIPAWEDFLAAVAGPTGEEVPGSSQAAAARFAPDCPPGRTEAPA